MELKGVIIGILSVVLALSIISFVYVNNNKNIAIQDLSEILNETKLNVQELQKTVAEKNKNISTLENIKSSLESQLDLTKEKVKQQEETIVKSTEQIQNLTLSVSEQQKRVQDIIEAQKSLSEEGKIIVDMYYKTLVLYDNSEIYLTKKPLFDKIKEDPQDYSKLGIPFFYFKDEVKQQGDNIEILGEYSRLYDYIYIYRNANSTDVIYHEIGHIIFKTFFLEDENNLNTWVSIYNNAKANNRLSSQYSYTDEVEGFAEEWVAHKTKSNPNQDLNVVGIMQQVDGFLKA